MNKDFDEDDLFFASMLAKAEVLSLLSILDEVCRHVDYRYPDGLSLEDRFYAQRKLTLERLFRSLEDGNAALAARLHERYEEARQELGDDRS